jgi:hypothetical protein
MKYTNGLEKAKDKIPSVLLFMALWVLISATLFQEGSAGAVACLPVPRA